MQKYKVLALYLGGIGNRIFNSGDIVSDANFPVGHTEELVKQKFIEPLDEIENLSDDLTITDSDANGSKMNSENDGGSEGRDKTADAPTVPTVELPVIDKVDDSAKQSAKKQASAKK